MNSNTLSNEIEWIREYAYNNNISMENMIEILKLREEKKLNNHLESIEYSLSSLRGSIDEMREEIRKNEGLSRVETSIYSITTAIENIKQ